MKLVFFRNVKDYNQLCNKATLFSGIVAECKIVNEINLNEKDYKLFVGNFLKSYDFLLKYVNIAIIAEDVWYGILVKGSEDGVVVVMNGYQYPRFVSLKDKNKDK